MPVQLALRARAWPSINQQHHCQRCTAAAALRRPRPAALDGAMGSVRVRTHSPAAPYSDRRSVLNAVQDKDSTILAREVDAEVEMGHAGSSKSASGSKARKGGARKFTVLGLEPSPELVAISMGE